MFDNYIGVSTDSYKCTTAAITMYLKLSSVLLILWTVEWDLVIELGIAASDLGLHYLPMSPSRFKDNPLYTAF